MIAMLRLLQCLPETVGLKIRLNLLIAAALLASVALGGALAIHNYRRAVNRETEASVHLVLGLLGTRRGLNMSAAEASRFRERLSREIPALTRVRHIRLSLVDAAGRPLAHTPVSSASKVHRAPGWFVRLVAPPPKVYRVPISLAGGATGFVVVSTDPDDEVAEEWANTRDLFAVTAMLFLALWVLVVWYVRHALRPLDELRAGFEALGRGEFGARVAARGAPELVSINRKFNEMAQALEVTNRENRRLSERLIDLRDEERRAIARELHDNLAQYLFAIRTDAFAIQRMAAPALEDAARSISESAARMEVVVRDMIQRLRPLVLDELGLKDALHDLVATWRTCNPRIACRLQIDAPLDGQPKEVELAVYHIVQESLTNVAKHSAASTASVTVRTANEDEAQGTTRHGEPILEVVVEDSGQGPHAVARDTGMGLVGMRERVETLGGRLETTYRPGCGWRVMAMIPLAGRRNADAA